MRKIIFDKRWEGGTGIGRFSFEISKRNNFDCNIESNIKPTSPVDILLVPLYLIFNNSVYFTPGFNAPYFFIRRSVITVHDLNHIDINSNSSFIKRLYYNLILKRGCKKALAVLTVSEFSKKRIVEWSGVDASKVTVVGNGVSKEFNPVGEKYDLGSKYIFCVSNRKTHKNEERLIKAYAEIKHRIDAKLVFSGIANERVSNLLSSLGLKNDVLFTGFIEEDELPKYYRGATALVMPSLYEGFGLPVIEAMACGIPTIASKTTSLGEISGSAALLVDPENTNEISDAIVNVLNNEELRKKLIEDGIERAKLYTWDNVANKVRKVISEVR